MEAPKRMGSGLVADVLYLRPAHRPPLLRALAELGIFVREAQVSPVQDIVSFDPRGDLVLALADASGGSVEAIRELAARGTPVVAVVENAEARRPLVAAGATAVLSESLGGAALRNALNGLARIARSRRTAAESSNAIRVFGSLQFRTSPPELVLGSKVAPLSPVELELMRTFARFHGELVPRLVLRGSLERDGRVVSDGYLKTVILRIRRKAQSLGGNPELLAAVRGIGYILRG